MTDHEAELEKLCERLEADFPYDGRTGELCEDAIRDLVDEAARLLREMAAEIAHLRPLSEKNLRTKLRDGSGDTLGTLIDNQAWVLFSHVASRIGKAVGNPDLMEAWQEAWAEGQVQKGYFSAHRGAAAWIAADFTKRLAALTKGKPHD